MNECCSLSYPTECPIFAETVHAVHHVPALTAPVRIQLMAGTSQTGRVVNNTIHALQATPGSPAADLEKVIAAGRIVESVVLSEKQSTEDEKNS